MVSGNGCGRPAVGSRAFALVVGILLAGQAAAAPRSTDPRLSVTLEHGAGGSRHDGCAWQPGFTIADLDGNVGAMTVFDDGTGSALFAGGRFRTAGGALVNNAARWDGSSWSPLSGPSGTGTGGSSAGVQALATYDDGSGSALYFGGDFILAGGETVYKIARWDGAGWSALTGPSGTGTYHAVSALAAFDDGSSAALYVGGAFITAGGVTVNRIARWDGETWSALGGPSGIGMDGPVYALCVFDDGSGPALYAGGNFDTAGGSR